MRNSLLAGDIALPEQFTETPDWCTLGFQPYCSFDRQLQGTVPTQTAVLVSTSPDNNQNLSDICKTITTSAPFHFKVDGCSHYTYQLSGEVNIPTNKMLPVGIKLLRQSDPITLTEDFPVVGSFPVLTNLQVDELFKDRPEPPVTNSPLQRYSLRGQSEEFTKNAVAATSLLGHLCLAGQATVWYAPPNAGKTLIALKLLSDAISENRISPDNVWYINADDSSEGFATKIRLMDDLGVHTIAPGFQGFEAGKLPELFHEMARANKAKGSLIIIDTIKKVASLMDKNSASTFTAACRAAVMAGATIVGFAHTNKQPSASGKLQYAGTTDLRDDFDAAYIMEPVQTDWSKEEKVVKYEAIKTRGSNAQYAAYAYSNIPDISYEERLASVRTVGEEEIQGFRVMEEEKSDAEIIEAISHCISTGEYAKMALAKAASKRSGASERQVIRTIDKYKGTDPAQAKWTFERKAKGAMIFRLLSSGQMPAANSS